MNDIAINCNIEEPYPPVKAECKNMFFASLLTNDYAGSVSEMSSISVYTYQHIITKSKKIADALASISLVEMRHMEQIGELISKLGGNPRIAVQSGCNSIYWSSQYLSYETNPKNFLKENIASEMAAIANYRTRINQISDKFVKQVLERIILDEELHAKVFTELLEELA